MVRGLLKSKSLWFLSFTSAFLPSLLLAADSNPAVMGKHLLPNAVQIQITQRGMKIFDSKLSSILGNLGIKLDEGYFPAMSYTFDKDISPDDLAGADPETAKIYKQVRDLLTNWLVGFSLNDHRPTIEIGESGYVAQFSRFGLVTDETLMNTLGKRDGAILAIELEVKKVTLSTQSIKAWDLNNEFLGQVGFENINVEAANNEVPLRVRLPFYIRSRAGGGLDFEALEIEHNIQNLPITLQYQKILLPTFAIEVNGKKFYVNNSELEKLIGQQIPAILTKVRESLGDFASKQLPEMLNQKAKEYLSGSLEQVQDMIPPGKEENDRRPDFKWGLQLNSINLKKSLNISLSGYAEDPMNPRSAPKSQHQSRGAPNLSSVAQENYDLSLSLDRSLINRILQLSFERKNFSNIKLSNGDSLSLRATPVIDFVKTPSGIIVKPQETFVKLRVSVENKPSSMFLKDTIVIDFDIIAKLRQLEDKSGMQLVLYKIDEDSMYLDESYMTWLGKLAKSKVRAGVKKELREKCAGWTKKEETIPGSLPLPPEILGLKLDIHKVQMDPNGHVVMFLNYAKSTLGVK